MASSLTSHVDWLNLTREEVLEPELPICDAHHHFWNDGRDADYLPADLVADIQGTTGGSNNVVSSVFCEASWNYRKEGPDPLRPVGETEAVAALTIPPGGRLAAAIVGMADLRLGDAVGEVLDAHRAASSRFRGVRYWSTWDERPAQVGLRHVAPQGLLSDAAFRKGIAQLGRRKLSFDAWMLFPQLPDLASLAAAFPDVTMVVGHFGGLVGIGPYANRAETFAQWKKNIALVAAHPNVVMKLGGVGIERVGHEFNKRDKPAGSLEVAEIFKPYVSECVELFGPDRCLFESNFPVDKRALSYTVIWNAFKRITQGFSSQERAALFRGTAERVYRL